MCGFVAVFGPGAPTPEPVLTAMRDRLAHRGPDGAGNWSTTCDRGSVSFGFRRLAVIDTRHVADQPMQSGDGRKVIVFNGEIYNYVELRAELEGLGHMFATRSDTEVLLQAYEEWGDDLLTRLNGMFTFVIWDDDRGAALVARDRFGEKPLYWARTRHGGIVFASEIKGLLAHPDVDAPLDRDLVGRIAAGLVPFGLAGTPFKRVEQFGAAHRMVVSADGQVREYARWWAPTYGTSLAERPRAEVRELFLAHLERSVMQRMRADVRLTACLSGGLDSSTLVATMARRGLDSAISARFSDDPTIDEGPQIDAVLARSGVTGRAVAPTADELARDLRALHWHHETVIPGASMYLEWAVMRDARAAGYTVIIDGQGADEVLAGYQIYFQAWQAEMFARGDRAEARFRGWQRDRRLQALARDYDDAGRRFPLRDSLRPDQLPTFMLDHVVPMAELYGGDGVPSPHTVGALRFELAINLLRTSLPSNVHSGDRNSMAHGIECRYPFLDYELVDFATQLPDWAYLGGGWGKRILRDVTADRLPDSIRWRVDKVGFAAPQDRWILTKPVRAWLEERLFDPSLVDFAGYDALDVEQRWGLHLAGRADHSAALWRWASAAELLEMDRQGMWHA